MPMQHLPGWVSLRSTYPTFEGTPGLARKLIRSTAHARPGEMRLRERRRHQMEIVLDHTIVPARDKELSARFLARILGLPYEGPASHFAPVRINDTLTLDYDNESEFESHHYAFKVDEAAFDDIFNRILEEGIPYGSG